MALVFPHFWMSPQVWAKMVAADVTHSRTFDLDSHLRRAAYVTSLNARYRRLRHADRVGDALDRQVVPFAETPERMVDGFPFHAIYLRLQKRSVNVACREKRLRYFRDVPMLPFT